jgi:hypothetical protein
MEAEPEPQFPGEPELFSSWEKEFEASEEPPSFLDRLIEDTHAKFYSQTFIDLGDGNKRIYDTFDAAEEALNETGLVPYFLLGIISDLTTMTPKVLEEIVGEDLIESEDLEEVIESINIAYLSAELVEKYPEVVEIEQGRVTELEE